MEQLTWSSRLELGIIEMDNAHQTLIQELTALMLAPDHEFAARLRQIVDLLERDFHEEEVLMEKMNYAELRAHRADHAKLLSTLHHVVPLAMSGDLALPRQVLNMLPQWFLKHLVHMDVALVKALNLAGAEPARALPEMPGMPQMQQMQPQQMQQQMPQRMQQVQQMQAAAARAMA